MLKEGFSALVGGPLLLTTLTVAVYVLAVKLYKWTRAVVLHPLLTGSLIIIGFLKLTGIDYRTYYEANAVINFMLGLSIVSLGYLLYENYGIIKDRIAAISVSVLAGSMVGVLGVAGLSLLLGLDNAIISSFMPKSVTAPIAIELSGYSGGDPALTSLAVVATGILGSIIGPPLMKVLRVTDPVARGLALGSASHAVGTARAIEMGAVEGAAGGAAIGLMGAATAIMIPVTELII